MVRLGHLCLDDFLRLEPEALDTGDWTPDLGADWSLAVNNAPHIQRHFRFQIADCRFPPPPIANRQSSVEDVHAAQQRLVAHFALDLLRAKAPPLYDALPWHDWDFSIVAKRFKLWQTRFLLAGDGTTVTMCRCRKSAGVYVVEPDESIARYTERKAAIGRIRRFCLVSPKPQAASLKLSEIPLPCSSVDLAVIGSSPDLQTANCKLVIQELLRVTSNVLLVENNPLAPPLDDNLPTDAGFQPDSVAVSGLGLRRCWWHTP